MSYAQSTRALKRLDFNASTPMLNILSHSVGVVMSDKNVDKQTVGSQPIKTATRISTSHACTYIHEHIYMINTHLVNVKLHRQ